jgi:FLVCR family MFS transporter
MPWQQTTWGLDGMLYQWVVIAGVLFVAILAYFPDAPPTPPSESASLAAESFSRGFKILLTTRDFWLLAIAAGVSSGFWIGLQSVLSVMLAPPPWNMNDNVIISGGGGAAAMIQSSAWLGTWATVAGVAGGLLAGGVGDKTKAYKLILIVVSVASLGMFAWFVATVFQYVRGSLATLFVSLMLAALFLNATTPLYIELACEVAYPAPAGIVDSTIQLFVNAAALVFQTMGIGPILNAHPHQLAYALPAAVAASVVLLLFVKGEHKRLRVDLGAAGDAGGRAAGTTASLSVGGAYLLDEGLALYAGGGYDADVHAEGHATLQKRLLSVNT